MFTTALFGNLTAPRLVNSMMINQQNLAAGSSYTIKRVEVKDLTFTPVNGLKAMHDIMDSHTTTNRPAIIMSNFIFIFSFKSWLFTKECVFQFNQMRQYQRAPKPSAVWSNATVGESEVLD